MIFTNIGYSNTSQFETSKSNSLKTGTMTGAPLRKVVQCYLADLSQGNGYVLRKLIKLQ